MDKFINRSDAGKILAEALFEYQNQLDVIVLALPRGGVPVAFEIAKILSLPLDIFIVRKLGAPHHKELAMGAIASGGTIIFNEDVISELSISQSAIQEVIQSERQELRRRELLYRGDRPFPTLTGKRIIIVDDGIATGATMRAAISALRKDHPLSIIMAIPVAARSTYEEMSTLVDKIVCPLTPAYFYAVGAWYDEFPQVTDQEVIALLKEVE